MSTALNQVQNFKSKYQTELKKKTTEIHLKDELIGAQ